MESVHIHRPQRFLSTMWCHSYKVAGCEPGSKPSQKTRLASALFLDFPASKTQIECISVVYELSSTSYFVTVPHRRIELSLKCLLNVMNFVDLKIWRTRLNLKDQSFLLSLDQGALKFF